MERTGCLCKASQSMRLTTSERKDSMQAVSKYRLSAVSLAVSFILCLVVNYLGASPRALAHPEGQTNIAPRKEYAAAVEAIERFMTHEMADKELPALSIALV